MRALLLAVCILFSGCTRIAFTVPVGKPVPPADAADLTGAWTGEKGEVLRVEQEPGSGDLIVKGKEDGKEQNCRISLTTVGNDVPVLWAEDKDLKAYIPFRVSLTQDGDALALLYPDINEVKKLVNEAKLAGVYNEGKKAWIISQGDWTAVLEGKEFWEIDVCLVFTRNKRVTGQPPAADTPPASQGSRQP